MKSGAVLAILYSILALEFTFVNFSYIIILLIIDKFTLYLISQLITLPVYLINLSMTRVASGVFILDLVNYVNYINLVNFDIVYSKIDMKLTVIDN